VLPVVAVAAALAAGCSSGADGAAPNQAPPPTTGPVAISAAPVVPSGFKAVTLRVTAADGSVHESCVLVAITETDRARGLMDVDSLGGYDGMLFRFGGPTSAQFYMFHTRLALTVAFFDRDGAYVSSRDMPPCAAAKGSDCPVYGAERSYVDALEVVQGGLGGLGVAPGSRIDVGAGCSRSF
jgi:uncharacterized membrane protein (UPF0127 family)